MSSERQEHNENTPWWGEHIHRYYAVLSHITPSDKILDIACGNGFGTYLLSKKTTEMVIGADISVETVDYCSKTYPKQTNLKFKVVDGTNMPFENNYFDHIISFETIEHTMHYKEMITEFHRTLRNGGFAIISTPNIKVNSPTGVVLNPFHTQEFTYEEFKLVLEGIFDEVKIYGQKYIRYETASFRHTVSKFVENILYLKGFRKIPLSIQNRIMRFFVKKDMYPAPDDFVLTDTKQELLKCKTFFAKCRKL